jgi:hypothetical protein
MWESISTTTINLILYWLAAAWILLFEKKKGVFSWSALVMPVGIAGMALLSALFLGNRFQDKIVLLLPTALVLCYAGVGIAHNADLKKTWLIVVMYAIIIQAGLNLRYDGSIFQVNRNPYRVSDTVIRIADAILADEELESPYLIAPDEIASQIQEYNTDIRVIYGLDFVYDSQDVEGLLINMDNFECNCLVVPEQEAADEQILSAGYRTVMTYQGYKIYARI